MTSADTVVKSPLFCASFERRRTANAGCSCASRVNLILASYALKPTFLLFRDAPQTAHDQTRLLLDRILLLP